MASMKLGGTLGNFNKISLTWTPKVCRIMALSRFWAIILPTFRCLGMVLRKVPIHEYF